MSLLLMPPTGRRLCAADFAPGVTVRAFAAAARRRGFALINWRLQTYLVRVH